MRGRHAAAYLDHDGLLHLDRDHLADLLVLQSLLRMQFGHVISSLPRAPSRAGWCRCGGGTRRLTSTTMVFCILTETTWPIFSFFNPCFACNSAMLFLRSLELPLAQDGVDAGAGLAHGADLLQPVHLPHRHLKV